MKKYNINTNLIKVIKKLYDVATSADLSNSSIGDWFRTTAGVDNIPAELVQAGGEDVITNLTTI